MKITLKTEVATSSFGSLSSGEVFAKGTNVFMKVAPHSKLGESAINLETGEIVGMGFNEEVMMVNSHLSASAFLYPNHKGLRKASF